MAVTLTSLSDIAALGFDSVIDVRSPSEFAEDHVPGAISLPVLDDEERARVGTIYKQDSPFKARKIGAALVAKNAAAHIQGPLADMDGGWRPLVYCWRGGQRSGSFAMILGQIGWRAETVQGGYKAFRGLVVKALYETPFPAPVIVLDGNTGTAKTDLLHLLRARGVQVIDLEGLANHRGSLFGHRAGGQPAQKGFETALAMEIAALDPARPVVVEAESSKVGDLRLPPKLWRAMCDAPRIHVSAPLSARAAYLARAYADLTADIAALHDVIDKLRPMQPGEAIERWHGYAEAGTFEPLAAELMEMHYDPRYNRQRARTAGEAGRTVMAEDLSEAALPDLADRIRDLI
ncbi:tRNA 2-selenouridine(34) synthase MnmH [Acidimangrovimonas sediminis]|uniref:tRNA 2-selenouridine(34) synthase MnmH n=1 Tax=Acidimangrovimonas sediminis TaxID=2056283 RepID=UPI000C805366|nr:tRNA 2-selenouridine(34) synthase MnmH [Acidimangrovimonas sediminis]